MGKRNIYMDTAASTKPSEKVFETMIRVVDEYANPSSIHDAGVKAKSIIDESRNIIANTLSCDPDEIHFTSGATMGNQLAIQGWLRANPNGIVMINKIEHNDIIELGKYLERNMTTVDWINVDHNGHLDLKQLEDDLKYYSENYFAIPRPILVVCQIANSEVGVVQDIKAIAYIVHKYNGTLFTDATQYIPHFITNVNKLDVDMLSMSGQKINCIKGTGILYIRKGIHIESIIFGEQGLIGGTENTIGIACLGTAFGELIEKHKLGCYSSIIEKRNRLIDVLSKYGTPVLGKYSDDNTDIQRLPNNVAIMFKGISGEDMVQLLNEHGIYASSGSACSSYVTEPSHVLKAMGYSDEDASSCVRFTIDENITNEDIDYVGSIVRLIINMKEENDSVAD